MEADEDGAKESQVLSSRVRIQSVIPQTENQEIGSRNVLFRNMDTNCQKAIKGVACGNEGGSEERAGHCYFP